MHIVDILKVGFLIKLNIIKPKRIVVDLNYKIITVRSYNNLVILIRVYSKGGK